MPKHMPLFWSPKNAKEVVSSLEPKSKNCDNVSKAFFLSILRCLLYSLSKGKKVLDNKRLLGSIWKEGCEALGFEGEFFEDIHW